VKIGDRVRITTRDNTTFTGLDGTVVDTGGLQYKGDDWVEVLIDGMPASTAECFYAGEYEVLVDAPPESPHYFVD
jgi:hypothetical protein